MATSVKKRTRRPPEPGSSFFALLEGKDDGSKYKRKRTSSVGQRSPKRPRRDDAKGVLGDLQDLILDVSDPAPAGEDAERAAVVAQVHPNNQSCVPGVDQTRCLSEQDARAIESLIRRIDEATTETSKRAKERERSYIGASTIGDPCIAYLALNLRGFPSDMPDPQMLRIFDEGHRVELLIVAAMRAAGVTLSTVDPTTGKQYHASTMGGHVCANLDGLVWARGKKPGVDAPTFLFEAKSMNRAFFMRFKKHGLAVSHPEYVDQVTLGMGLHHLERALVVAYCKDNSQFHGEIIRFDNQKFVALETKAATAMYAQPPTGVDTFACTMCFKRTACRKGAHFTTCRHCEHSTPRVDIPGAQWWCRLHEHKAEHVCGDFKPLKVIILNPARKR